MLAPSIVMARLCGKEYDSFHFKDNELQIRRVWVTCLPKVTWLVGQHLNPEPTPLVIVLHTSEVPSKHRGCKLTETPPPASSRAILGGSCLL